MEDIVNYLIKNKKSLRFPLIFLLALLIALLALNANTALQPFIYMIF